MRRLLGPLLFGIVAFLLILGGGILWTARPGSEAAYQAAEARIQAAKEEELRVLRFRDLGGLGHLPPELGEMGQVIQLDLSGTVIADISVLSGMENLRILTLRDTLVEDLSPLRGLENLDILDVSGTWVRDLTPLAEVPRLRRLDIGRTWVTSLDPLQKAQALDWINLHGTVAFDGSQDHMAALAARGVTVNNGRAMAENYRPGFVQRMRLRFHRLSRRVSLGFATSG